MTRRKWLDVAVVMIPFALGVRLANGQETEDGGVAQSVVMELRWIPGVVPYPPGTLGVGTNDLTFPGTATLQPLYLGVFISGWGALGDGTLGVAQGTLDSATLPQGLFVFRPGCLTAADCEAAVGVGSVCGPPPLPVSHCVSAIQDTTRPDWDGWGSFGCSDTIDDLWCFVNVSLEPPHADPNTPLYVGTFVLAADSSLAGGAVRCASASPMPAAPWATSPPAR